MLQKATALPLCSVIDILWYRYVVSSGSLVIVVIHLSRSSMNSADCGHQAPLVSMVTGLKECVAAKATYFVALLMAASSAAVQAVVEVSVGVTPSSIGDCHIPSERFATSPRDQSRSVGPFTISPQ